MNKIILIPLAILMIISFNEEEKGNNYPISTMDTWGFHGHQLINRIAVFSLPPKMINFYKANIKYLADHAVDPDKRRYAVDYEAPRHYIDLDEFHKDSILEKKLNWHEAITIYSEDTLSARGIVPWHVLLTKYQLTEAFKSKQWSTVLKLSADIGHYIADANVPLHTTKNYNGQLTNQHGIHGFWESRIPELFSEEFDLFAGKAQYFHNPREVIWEAIGNAHQAVDTVLQYEKALSQTISEDRKYSYEERNGKTVKVYSYTFTRKYNNMLNQMVERQMKASIKCVASFWYTSWVDAGQPVLPNEMDVKESLNAIIEQESRIWQNKFIPPRKHE